ncbi:hypothetical protein J6590_013608 [Homalodisca vitripennis]|nr:hypothetical protein J6590_013608 [Homalodisca vitripennis]
MPESRKEDSWGASSLLPYHLALSKSVLTHISGCMALSGRPRPKRSSLPHSDVIYMCYKYQAELGSREIKALVNLNKGVPPPAYFDWRGCFRAGLPSFRDDFEM